MKSTLNYMTIRQKVHEAGEYADGDMTTLLDICRDLLDEIERLEERLELLEPEVL
jgi:hypothetical protein